MSPQELEILRKKARNIFIVGFIITIILTLASFIILKSFFSVFFVLIFDLKESIYPRLALQRGQLFRI